MFFSISLVNRKFHLYSVKLNFIIVKWIFTNVIFKFIFVKRILTLVKVPFSYIKLSYIFVEQTWKRYGITLLINWKKCQDFYWLQSGLIKMTHKWSMRPLFAKVFIQTGFEPVLNWFQPTGLITLLQAVAEWYINHSASRQRDYYEKIWKKNWIWN